MDNVYHQTIQMGIFKEYLWIPVELIVDIIEDRDTAVGNSQPQNRPGNQYNGLAIVPSIWAKLYLLLFLILL